MVTISRRCRAFAIVLLVCFVFAAGAGARAAMAQDPAQVLPPDVLFMISIRDYPALVSKLQRAPVGALLSEAEVKEFLSAALKKVQEAAPPQAREGLPRLMEVLKRVNSAIGGQVLIAVGELDRNRKPPVEVLLLADVTGHTAEVRQMLDELLAVVAQQEAAQVAVAREQLQGKDVVKLVGPQGGTLFYTLDQNTFMACADGRGLLEKVLARQQAAGAPSLRNSDAYRRCQANLGETADLTVYLNFQPLWPLLPAGERVPPGQAGGLQVNWRDVAAAAGLSDVRAFGMTVALEPDGVRGRGLLVAPAPRRGLLRAFEPAKGDVTPPAFVEADATSFSSFYFDASVFWAEVMNLLARFQPGAYQMLRMQIDMQRQTPGGIDLENDVIGAFGTRWVGYVPGQPVTAGTPQMLNQALAVRLNKPEAFERALRQVLAGVPQGVIAALEHRGTTVYQFPPMPQAPGAPFGAQWHLALAKEDFILASNLDLMRQLLDGGSRPRSPLLDNAEYGRLVSRLISDPQGLSYSDDRKAGQVQWAQMAPLLRNAGLSLPWETLRKYAGVSASAWKWAGDGLLIDSWHSYPARPE